MFHPRKMATWAVLLLVAGLWLLATALSVGEAYILHDPAQIWGIKGYGIALEGTVRAGEWWGVHGLAYPLNVPLFASIFYLVDGDALPGSKLIFPLLGAMMIGGSARFLYRHGVSAGMTAVGALLITSIPAFFYQATRGMANVPFTAYLVLGLLWSIEGILEGRKGAALIGGLLWGLACWTRAEGVLFVVALAALLILLAGRRRIRARTAGLWLGPILVLSGSWFVFSRPFVQESHLWLALTAYAGSVAAEGSHKVSVILLAKGIVLDSIFVGEPRTVWGASAAAALLALGFSLGRLVSDRSRTELAVVLGGALCGALSLSMFYIRSYSKPEFFAFVQRSLPRALFPAAVLLVVAAALMLASQSQALRPDLPQSDATHS
jgi:4-amino-4-deoxy-L-arabinose transferase-like glycosyltransferase